MSKQKVVVAKLRVVGGKFVPCADGKFEIDLWDRKHGPDRPAGGVLIHAQTIRRSRGRAARTRAQEWVAKHRPGCELQVEEVRAV